MQLRHADTAARLTAQLRRIVARGDISVSEIARRTGYTQSHLSNVIAGRRKMPPDMADSLMHATGTTLADLYAGDELRELRRWIERQTTPAA